MSDDTPPPIAGEPEPDPAIEIERLAKLSAVEYDRQRVSASETLGCRVATLDKLVAAAAKNGTNGFDEAPVEVLEPWPDEVNGADLAAEIAELLDRHVVLPDGCAKVIALWCLGTYCYNAFRLFPKLLISSPERRCGKTTLMETLEAVCRAAVLMSSGTSSVLFRLVDAYHPTLLLDEIDRWIKGDDEGVIGIVNAGHSRRSAYVWRAVGDDHTPTKFSVWGPMALAGIKTPADTIVDRSIEIEMNRKAPGETRERLPVDLHESCRQIRQKAERWAIDNADDLRADDPFVPSVGNDRAEDNWRVILSVAAEIGWYDVAVIIFKKMCANRAPDDTAGILLLADIRDHLKDKERIFSDDLTNALVKLDDRPWSEWGRQNKPITTNGLARLLKPFKVAPTTLRIGDGRRKGYEADAFDDAFRRYLPSMDVPSVTPGQTTEYVAPSLFETVTPDEPVTDAESPQANDGAGCHVVTDEAPRNGAKTKEWRL